MESQPANIYEFGAFRLDTQEKVLLREGEAIALAPKVFETLRLLVERHGHIIDKRALMDAVWPDLFVEESNLTQNIYILRRILGADKSVKGFIENVPRRGYRFIAPVRLVNGLRTDRDEKEFEILPDGPDGPAIGLTPGASTNDGSITRNRQYSVALISTAAGVLVLTLLGFAAFRYFFATNEKATFTPIENVKFQKLTFTGDLTFPVIAPDGNSFAFVRGGQIIVQDIESGNVLPLNVSGGSAFGILQFSPDGNSIYFRNRVGFDRAGSVFQVSRFGGRPDLIAEDVWSGFGVSPDGKQLAFVRSYPNEARSSLLVKDLSTGAERSVAMLDQPSTFLDNGHPAWSPDGLKIAAVVFRNRSGSPVSQLIVVDVESSAVDEVQTLSLWQLEQAAWLPDGSAIIISAREAGKFFQLWRLAYPGRELQKITNDLNIYRGLSLSKDGRKLLARQFTLFSHIWTTAGKDMDSMEQRTFGNLNRDGLGGLEWMPNGDVLYVARITGNYDLWVYDPAEDTRRQLTKGAGELNRTPAVSSDGKYIYFDSNRTGTSHIWRMDASGANQEQVTFGEKQAELFPQLSPDDRWLYYIQKGQRTSAVWRKSLIGDTAEPLTESGKVSPSSFLAVSPDGKFLAFQNSAARSDEENEPRLYQVGIISTDTLGDPTFVNIAASRLIVKWSRDGSALDYIENDSAGARIWRQPLGPGQPPAVIQNLPKTFLHNFAWSADGTKLALSRGQQSNDAILLTNFQP